MRSAHRLWQESPKINSIQSISVGEKEIEVLAAAVIRPAINEIETLEYYAHNRSDTTFDKHLDIELANDLLRSNKKK